MQLIVVFIVGLVAVCILTTAIAQLFEDRPDEPYWSVSKDGLPTAASAELDATEQGLGLPPRRPPGSAIYTPTPDAPHLIPTLRTDSEVIYVQTGDTLGQIASRYEVSIPQLIEANQLVNPDLLEVGQILTIPVPTPQGSGPGFKVIPDSELVFGPASVLFDLNAFMAGQGGYLASYKEEVDGQSLSGWQVVERIAQDFSVNPRILLAVLEYQSGWVTNPTPDAASLDYPMRVIEPQRKGLYRQLAWAANNLNRGYYLWRVNGVPAWLLADGSVVPASPLINAGTASVQHLFALLYDRANWEKAVLDQGLFATYNRLFGYPFDYAIEPLLPNGLSQPVLQLPIETGTVWAFTGGPHGGWGDGAAWAALDFAPPGDEVGCVQSNAWVVAAADGLIVRADNGAVIQDLDGDGLEQTGWVVLYMHIESRDRVKQGAYLKAGDRIGHPSCEGGVSTGTHLHLARRYNGEWIAADQNLPFILDGWVSSGAGVEYDGYLNKAGESIEAYAGRLPNNGIGR